jgi:4-hydroxybenzoate polyprenyltransferase
MTLKGRQRPLANLAMSRATWQASHFSDVARLFRAHHWTKNLLVYLPLITSHRIFELALLSRASVAFAAFSLCASGVYVINDLLDLGDDRAHATKRNRPVAAGRIAPRLALALGIAALGLAFVAGSTLGSAFQGLLGLYVAATTAYSLKLKKIAVLNVLIVAAFYEVRIVAGGLVTGIVLSSWLIVFSSFLFLSLALLKRFQELGRAPQRILGQVSGALSALVLALYALSPEARLLYREPRVLWLLCLVELFWFGRTWQAAARGRVKSDLIHHVLSDWATYAGVGVGAVLLLVAKHGA